MYYVYYEGIMDDIITFVVPNRLKKAGQPYAALLVF